MQKPMGSKYRAKKVEVDGIRFDSRKEAERYKKLRILQATGEISDLQLQVKFELIPSQRSDGRVIERAVTYVADFTYLCNGVFVVEDVKGLRTPEYVIKRKLMLYIHGIRIKET